MFTTVFASVALLASTALAGAGTAIVINACNYDVHLSNTPAAGGGQAADDRILSSGSSYSQVYTQLSNGNGWSIKLSQSDNFGSDILQYEYTYHNDGIIWYDLSEVDGNPWDGNWEITATGSCTPRQAAYRFSTDDAYGMQSCPDDSSITVTLCSGDSGGAAPSSPAESPLPTSAPALPPTSAAPAPSPSWGGHNSWYVADKNVEAPAGDVVVDEKKAPSPTDDTWDGPAVTITNVHYETVTQIVTAAAHKRHVHHPRHPHHRHA